jgi:polyhydroxyalkanoate synthesis repressor PhaR
VAGSRRVIKKYGNRKLYDTETSRYVTLQGISALVRAGLEVQVIERDTGRDITSLVLSQIVLDEEKRGVPAEPGRDGASGATQLLDHVLRTLNVPASLVTQEAARRAGDLEEVVDRAIERALRRLRIPSRRDIERLDRRLSELSSRVDRITR